MRTPTQQPHHAPTQQTRPGSAGDRPEVDPLRSLWHHQGRPTPSVLEDRAGTCARCGTPTGEASRVKAVVSDKFTGWDAYTHTPDPLWCPPCTWGHTTSEVRTRPWWITPTGGHPATRDLLARLLSEPLPAHGALLVPLSRHKHLLPVARWGHLTTDDRTLTWTSTEATRFRTLRWLRRLGFSEAALHDPTPRFEVLTTVDPALMPQVLTAWADLAGWRADPTVLTVACHASRPTRTGTSA